LEGEDEGGELGTDTAIRVETSEAGERSALLEIRLDPAPDPAESPRLILADPGLNLSLRALTEADLAGEEPGVYRVTFPLAADADRVVVLVERATGGAWGGEVVFLQPGQESEETEAEALRPIAPLARPRGEDAGEGFRVRLVVPNRKLAGPVDVEADVRVPAGGKVERVELFWNDELAATLYSPPYRYRVMVPADRPAGYLRAEARLVDGTTAEDAVAINASDLGERVDVRLVELYVVVTDRDGKPVRGLPREAFRVRQDGQEQQLSHFENAGELPLTLALTIDSSASMFLKLPKVREAVSSLLDGGLSARDRALLVDFDTEPRLVRPVTRDLAGVSASLEALTPDGGSNLFEAIVFSLSQLQGVAGRKALVVYSDGIGEGEDTSYRACLRAARESGTPVYLIVTNAKAARGEDPSGFLTEPYSDKIRRLAGATGAKAYFVLPNQDLTGTYQEILEELRSQYTLSFYPNEGDRDPWQAVKVEVEGKGLTARTLSGYQARR
jgi:Ca-activated chloride channel family protein